MTILGRRHLIPPSRPHVVAGCSQYRQQKEQSTVSQNSAVKITRKLEDEVLITFVDRQLIDGSHVADSDLNQSCFILLRINGRKRASDINLFSKTT